MGQAIGEELIYAVGIALSPIAIIGVILMLGTPRGRTNGPAFVGGWIVGLALTGTVFLLLAGGFGADEGIGEADWVDVIKGALGALLIFVGVKQRRKDRSTRGEAKELPSWMRSVDHFTAGRAAATGVALAGLNPKNLVLIAAAAATISETGISAGEQAESLLVFVLLGTFGAAAPVGLYLVAGDAATDRLERLKKWMTEHNGAVIAVLCLVIGAKLIGEMISGLSG